MSPFNVLSEVISKYYEESIQTSLQSLQIDKYETIFRSSLCHQKWTVKFHQFFLDFQSAWWHDEPVKHDDRIRTEQPSVHGLRQLRGCRPSLRSLPHHRKDFFQHLLNIRTLKNNNEKQSNKRRSFFNDVTQIWVISDPGPSPSVTQECLI